MIDVGLTVEAGWAVVEANPCWGAGIYACDPSAVLNVLARACLPAHDVAVVDQRWFIKRTVEW